MDLKKFYFGEFVQFEKNHKSSYFGLTASTAVLIAFFLPGILGMISPYFSYFSTLILIAVAAFEKKSKLVKFSCIQFCFLAMLGNITLNVLSFIGNFFTVIQYINACLSLVFAAVVLFAFVYSIYNAFKFRGWLIPWLGDFIYKKFVE